MSAPLAEASAAVRETVEAARREVERRDAVRRMLAATDRALDRLERLNLAGQERIPEGERERMWESLAELPAHCRRHLHQGDEAQAALDSLFDVQERLLRWARPGRVDEDESEELTAALLDRCEEGCRWLAAQPGGRGQGPMPRDMPEALQGSVDGLLDHRLAWLAGSGRLRLYVDWSARLRRLRQEAR